MIKERRVYCEEDYEAEYKCRICETTIEVAAAYMELRGKCHCACLKCDVCGMLTKGDGFEWIKDGEPRCALHNFDYIDEENVEDTFANDNIESINVEDTKVKLFVTYEYSMSNIERR